MALRLLDFAKANGFRFGISKGSDKSNSDTSSPFVAFFWELQATMRSSYRRYCGSHWGLAQKLDEVRKREARKKLKPQEE